MAVSGPGAEATLLDNICRGNQFMGILFQNGAAGLAERNTCENNGTSGMAVVHKGTVVTLRHNRGEGNQEYGIKIDAIRGAEVTLDSNTVMGQRGQTN